MTRWPAAATLALIPILAFALLAAAQADAPPVRELADQRWQEHAYGLSLRPPTGAHTMQQTADEFMLRIADEAGRFTMSLAVKRSNSVLTIERVAESARQQVLGVQGTSQLLDSRFEKLADRPAYIHYIHVPQEPEGRLLAQAMLQIDAQTFAILDAHAPISAIGEIRPLFEAVLGSIELADPRELQKQREQALNMAQQWRQSLTIRQIHAALLAEQFYRILDAGKDIGYVRVRQSRTNRDGRGGIVVEVQSRLAAGSAVIDSLATYFMSDDDHLEQWTVTTTQRSDAIRAKSRTDQPNPTVVESGLRVGDTLTVTLDAPAGRQVRPFTRPRIGYVSQAETWLLPNLLPIDVPATYGYYAYHSGQGKLMFRTDELTPALGGFTITSRLSPNEPAITTRYDANRRLLQRDLGPNRVMTPTTAQMIQQLWCNR